MSKKIVQKNIAVVESGHTHKSQYEKAYVAKLTPSKDSYEFSRKFLAKKNILLKDDTFAFQWSLKEVGIYEMSEEYLNYTTKVSYFAINNNGDRVTIDKKKARSLVLKNQNHWINRSPLRIQLLGLAGPFK